MEYKLIDAPRLRFKADDPADGEEPESGTPDDGAPDDGSPDDAPDDAGAGTIAGYGSTFDDIDSYNERVLKGAFKDTIEEFVQDGFIAFAHNWGALPVATPKTAAEDDIGLKFLAEYHSTADAQAARTVVRERLQRQKTVKLSIGYEVLEDRQGTDKVRELVKLRLFEISIVTVPANVMAMVTEGKGRNGAHAGLRLKEHSEMVRATSEGLIKRFDELLELRTKEGRELSAANLAELDAIIEDLSSATSRAKTLRAKVDGKSASGPARTAEEKARHMAFLQLKYQRTAQGIYAPTE